MNRQTVYPKSELEWLQARTNDITSTEVSALFGISPYINEFELWHRKKSKDVVRLEENTRMKWGKRLEPTIAQGIAEDHDLKITPFKEYVRLIDFKVGSSFDYAIGTDGLLEIKNVDARVYNSGWEISGDDIQAPNHIEMQVQHQLLVSGRKYAFIGAFVGGNEITLLKREPDKDIQDAILNKVKKFWASIDSNTPPNPDFQKDAEFISHLYSYAEPGKIMQANDRIIDLAQKYQQYSQQMKVLDAARDGVKAELLTIIGDHEKVKGDTFSISAGLIGETEVSYTRKAYRNFKVTFKKTKE